jgi:hypothetical protein
VNAGTAKSGDDRVDGFAVVDLEVLASRHFQLVPVQPQLPQHRRVDVGDVVPVLDGVEADLVGRAGGGAALDAAAGQPRAEALRVVVAAVLPGGG